MGWNLCPSKLLLKGLQQMLADLLLVWVSCYLDSHKTTSSHVKVIRLKGFSKGELRPGEAGQRWGLSEQGVAWGWGGGVGGTLVMSLPAQGRLSAVVPWCWETVLVTQRHQAGMCAR